MITKIPHSQLLMTAVIRVFNVHGKGILARCLLDTCSTAHFVTEKFAKKLNIPRYPCAIPIGTIGDTAIKSIASVTIKLRSNYNNYEKILTCLTVSEIADRVPNEMFQKHAFQIPPHLQLADPGFHLPSSVDMLIGSGTTLSFFSIGQVKLEAGNCRLRLQKTVLGSVATDETINIDNVNRTRCHVLNLEEQIAKFWTIEEISKKSFHSSEEEECELHYRTKVTRHGSGRYIVRLPFRNINKQLGDSRTVAMRRLHALERRLETDPDLKVEYSRVMQEYLELNHMSLVRDTPESGYYLPHHAVVKTASETTKVRVMFDASAKSKSGVSLNDLLMVGPTIQDKLVTHLLRFRCHNYVLMADIEKMYRQVLIHPEDRRFQRILWRVNGVIETFELNTVTFGVSAAPFLAIRTIIQLAEDEENNFQLASEIMKRDLYVDNLITGSESLLTLRKIRDEVIQLSRRGGFHMREWVSNAPQILNDISEKSINTRFSLTENPTLNTLGIAWDAKRDCIVYSVNSAKVNGKVTKRVILSEIARLFDPLGLLGPVILRAKLLMQQCWKTKISWDESVPAELSTSWRTFSEQLTLIQDYTVDRRLIIDGAVDVQLHGFCDASESGYGACIYIRSSDETGKTSCKLLCAKSRVAPLKSISIPRAELCGALTLARLYDESREALAVQPSATYFWCDSTIVLSWIRSQPYTLKTFVANRVAEIQTATQADQWHHVRTENNPADALSRGQMPEEFLANRIWTDGPFWIRNSEDTWPNDTGQIEGSLPEMRKNICLMTRPRETPVNPDTSDMFSRASTYSILIRAIARCIRLFRVFRERKCKSTVSTCDAITITERTEAEITVLRIIQRDHFAKEIEVLAQSKSLTGNLMSLNPFLDEQGLLRVEGRLQNATIFYSQKHPILLPTNHHLTKLIIRETHERNFHTGIQTTLSFVPHRFWLLDGKRQVRSVVRRCNRCFRVNPKSEQYKMGNLPSARLQGSLPFDTTGIDYCGPIFIKEKKHRNQKRIKSYVCVFICMVSRAVHLEIVSDMTTARFLGAFRRFISRRGVPTNVHTDNGTNFVGARNELYDLFALFNSEEFESETKNFGANHNIVWHFNPPLAPHFGGIWEAAVKVFKHHFRRVVGDKMFTFEEVTTFATDIEAIMNSRPLCSLSSDPNDPAALTPAHFLTGRPLTQLPESDLKAIPQNRLSSWRLVTQAKQHFWKRWQNEYLHELQKRQKWSNESVNMVIGTIVTIRDNTLPPMQWILGRVVAVHPGKDGVVRAVTVQTAQGQLKRCVNSLCPLPSQ